MHAFEDTVGMTNDVHCHFLSTGFLEAIARQRGLNDTPAELCAELQWEDPGTAWSLADRWVQEMDANGVLRAALIASVPGDETSVAAAVARHPQRFVGFFMLNPAPDDALERTRRALGELKLRGVCLFPAMHLVPLTDDRVLRIVEVAADHPGTAVFVHCGALSIGFRKKLGLPNRFDMRLGDPLGVAYLAATFPTVPFIIPHFGSGLLREALIAADTCRNIYLDTSSSNGWTRYIPGMTLQAAYSQALHVAGPSRLLFGTDSSFFPRGWQSGVYESQRQLLDSLRVTPEDQELIFSGNFERLLPAPA
jgi:predicted TIM-barrel fold metal-dependent hydrolase